ncbi:MAG TPA: hypothetical protein VGP16_28440, partial [Asanoa sp.]|nr:hypothetical protein [Asanoa sp.]
VGTATALAGALWLMIGGFYVVRGAVARDETTRVGHILAATTLSRAGYLAGKFVSNLMVLASMAGVLAGTALVLQLARGESRSVDPVALLQPYLLLTLPVLAATAAAAILFETVPALRAGLGNIAWFFVWMTAMIAGAGSPFGGLGAVAASMRQAVAAQHLPRAGEFGVGFTKVDQPLDSFAWTGFHPGGGYVAGRLTLIVLAACLAVLPALWFGRFDPARGRAVADRATDDVAPVASAAPPRPRPYRLSSVRIRRRPATARLLAGEVRILVQGVSRWWWLVVAAITAASLAIPLDAGLPAGALLCAAWIWPILIWSRLGTQSHENGLDALLGSYPARRRRLAAEWAAGVLLAALTGVGPLLRMAFAGDRPGVAAWVAGALLIPSLALALGVATRTHRIFQVVYVILWYAVVNQVAAVDYMGAVFVDGHRAGPSPALLAGIAAAMLAAAAAIGGARHATR